SSGVELYRSPSADVHGSAVTSKRSRCQPRSAEASFEAVPGSPCQESSARQVPGAAGCLIQSRLTRAPRTPATAHSTCGHSARGAERTYRTPRVLTGTSSGSERRLAELPRLPAGHAPLRRLTFCITDRCHSALEVTSSKHHGTQFSLKGT